MELQNLYTKMRKWESQGQGEETENTQHSVSTSSQASNFRLIRSTPTSCSFLFERTVVGQ